MATNSQLTPDEVAGLSQFAQSVGGTVASTDSSTPAPARASSSGGSTLSPDELTGLQGMAQSAGGTLAAIPNSLGSQIATAAAKYQAQRGQYSGYCERLTADTVKGATGSDNLYGVNLRQNAIDTLHQAQKLGVGFPYTEGVKLQPGDIALSGRMGAEIGADHRPHLFGHSMVVGADGVVRSDLDPGVGESKIDWVIRPDMPRGGSAGRAQSTSAPQQTTSHLSSDELAGLQGLAKSAGGSLAEAAASAQPLAPVAAHPNLNKGDVPNTPLANDEERFGKYLSRRTYQDDETGELRTEVTFPGNRMGIYGPAEKGGQRVDLFVPLPDRATQQQIDAATAHTAQLRDYMNSANAKEHATAMVTATRGPQPPKGSPGYDSWKEYEAGAEQSNYARQMLKAGGIDQGQIDQIYPLAVPPESGAVEAAHMPQHIADLRKELARETSAQNTAKAKNEALMSAMLGPVGDAAYNLAGKPSWVAEGVVQSPGAVTSAVLEQALAIAGAPEEIAYGKTEKVPLFNGQEFTGSSDFARQQIEGVASLTKPETWRNDPIESGLQTAALVLPFAPKMLDFASRLPALPTQAEVYARSGVPETARVAEAERPDLAVAPPPVAPAQAELQAIAGAEAQRPPSAAHTGSASAHTGGSAVTPAEMAGLVEIASRHGGAIEHAEPSPPVRPAPSAKAGEPVVEQAPVRLVSPMESPQVPIEPAGLKSEPAGEIPAAAHPVAPDPWQDEGGTLPGGPYQQPHFLERMNSGLRSGDFSTPKPEDAPLTPNAGGTSAPGAPESKYAGSINTTKLGLPPEAIANLRETATRLGLDEKPTVSHAQVEELAKSLNLSYDDMKDWPIGERPVRPDGVKPDLWAAAWNRAIRNLQVQSQFDLLDAQDTARDAADAYRNNPVDQSKAALDDANAKLAEARSTMENMTLHDDTLADQAGTGLATYRKQAMPMRGQGYIESLKTAPTLDEALGAKAAPSNSGGVPSQESGPVRPNVPRPRAPRERSVSDEQYQAAAARLREHRGDAKTFLTRFVHEEEGSFSFETLGQSMQDLVTVGRYHYESGLRGFDRWRTAVESTLGEKLSDAEAKYSYYLTRGVIAQDVAKKQVEAMAPLFKDQLRELGRQGAAQFLHDLNPITRDKLLGGQPKDAFSAAERAEIAKHWDANTPERLKPATKESTNVARAIAKDGQRQARQRTAVDPVIRSIRMGLKGNTTKFMAEIEAAHPGVVDRLKSGDVTADEMRSIGEGYLKHAPAQSKAALTKGQEALHAAVREARAKTSAALAESQAAKATGSQAGSSATTTKATQPKAPDIPPAEQEIFGRRVRAGLGKNADNFFAELRNGHRDIANALDRGDDLTPDQTDRLGKLYLKHGTPSTPAQATAMVKALNDAVQEANGPARKAAAKAAAEARRAANPVDPFDELVGRRVQGGQKTATGVRLDLERDDVGQSAIRHLMNGEDLTNEEGRRLARAIDAQRRVVATANPDTVTARLTKLMSDARNGRLGYDDPLEAARAQMEKDARRDLDAFPRKGNPERRAQLQAEADAKIAAIGKDLAQIDDPHDGEAIGRVMMKHDSLLNRHGQYVLGNILSGTDTGVKIVDAHFSFIAAEEMRRWLFGDKSEVGPGIRAGIEAVKEKGLPEARQTLKQGSTAAHLEGKHWYRSIDERIPVESQSYLHRMVLRAHSAFYQMMQMYNTERGLHLAAWEDGKAKGLTGEDLADHVTDVKLHPERYSELSQKAIDFGKDQTQTEMNKLTEKANKVTEGNRAAKLLKNVAMPVMNLPLNAMKASLEYQTGLLSSRALARGYARMNPEATPEQIEAYRKKVFQRGAIGAGIAAATGLGTLLGGITPPDEEHGRYTGRINIGKAGFDVPAGPVGTAMDTGASLTRDVQTGDFSKVVPQMTSPYINDNPLMRGADFVTGLKSALSGNPREGHSANQAVGGLIVEHLPLSGLTGNIASALDRATGGGVRKKGSEPFPLGALDYPVNNEPGLRYLLPLTQDKENGGYPYPQGVLHEYPRVPQSQIDIEEEENKRQEQSQARKFLSWWGHR